jgi:hypothetical protein
METTTDKPLGALLPGIVDTSIDADISNARSIKPSSVLDLNTLPARLDDGTIATLREIVNSPLPAPAICDEVHFAKCIRSLAILPRQAEDEVTGPLKHKLYQAKLGGYSNDALSYLASKALEQCKWFPTIAECLQILAGFPNREIALERKNKAAWLVQRELNARLDEMVARLAKRDLTQDEIDALPEAAKLVAAEKCYLWAWPDGRFTVRDDISQMSFDDAEAERAKTKAMMAEWATIRAAQVEVAE